MALSAPLLWQKRLIKVALETIKGTEVAGTQDVLTEDLAINPTAPFIERPASGLYLGHAARGVIGERSGVCSFKTELKTNGAGGMEAGLAILLQACGFKKTLEVYQVHSTHSDDKTISIDAYEDGKLKTLYGASGKVTFDGEDGKPMYCNFEFSGVWKTPVDTALPTFAPSTALPLLMQGCTFTLGAEAIKINKYALDMGNVIVPRRDVAATGGIAYFMKSNFLPMLSLDPEADLVAGYDYYGKWLAGTEAAVSVVLTDTTDKVTFSTPKVQTRELTEGDRDGIMIYDLNGQCNNDSGDDSVVITAAAA